MFRYVYRYFPKWYRTMLTEHHHIQMNVDTSSATIMVIIVASRHPGNTPQYSVSYLEFRLIPNPKFQAICCFIALLNRTRNAQIDDAYRLVAPGNPGAVTLFRRATTR